MYEITGELLLTQVATLALGLNFSGTVCPVKSLLHLFHLGKTDITGVARKKSCVCLCRSAVNLLWRLAIGNNH